MTMSNLVTKAVESIYQMDSDQLEQVIEAIKLKRQHLARQATRNIIRVTLYLSQGDVDKRCRAR